VANPVYGIQCFSLCRVLRVDMCLMSLQEKTDSILLFEKAEKAAELNRTVDLSTEETKLAKSPKATPEYTQVGSSVVLVI